MWFWEPNYWFISTLKFNFRGIFQSKLSFALDSGKCSKCKCADGSGVMHKQPLGVRTLLIGFQLPKKTHTGSLYSDVHGCSFCVWHIFTLLRLTRSYSQYFSTVYQVLGLWLQQVIILKLFLRTADIILNLSFAIVLINSEEVHATWIVWFLPVN